VDRLVKLAAHGERQQAGEFSAGEGEHRGLTADWKEDECRALPPEAQQVLRDTIRAFNDPSESGDPRAEIDIAPGIASSCWSRGRSRSGSAVRRSSRTTAG
jgi:hypothetical protein